MSDYQLMFCGEWYNEGYYFMRMHREQMGLPTETTQDRRGALLKKLAEMRARVETWADAEGHGIDSGIKETIAVLNAADVPTTQSCEGHPEPERGRPYPWVRIAAGDEPAERYEGEAAAFEAMSRAHGVPLEDLKRGSPDGLYWEVRRSLAENEETPAYREWEKRNAVIVARVQAWIDEFYHERSVSEGTRLIIEVGAAGSELRSDESLDRQIAFGEVSPEDYARIVQKLPERQAELRDFTAFVLRKYLDD